jgi:hypothetical protein
MAASFVVRLLDSREREKARGETGKRDLRTALD